jgi:hypothetical protein
MARARYRDRAEGAFRTRAASHDRGLPRRRDRDCGGISGVTGSGPSRDALHRRPRPICFARPDRRSEWWAQSLDAHAAGSSERDIGQR